MANILGKHTSSRLKPSEHYNNQPSSAFITPVKSACSSKLAKDGGSTQILKTH